MSAAQTPAELTKMFAKMDNIESVQPIKSTGKHNSTKFKAFNFDRRSYMRYSMPACHFDSYNLWILKPTHLNRGRGIHVFRDLDTLQKLIK